MGKVRLRKGRVGGWANGRRFESDAREIYGDCEKTTAELVEGSRSMEGGPDTTIEDKGATIMN